MFGLCTVYFNYIPHFILFQFLDSLSKHEMLLNMCVCVCVCVFGGGHM